MGVHTGDSITGAPAQTLTDKEYQRLRDASIAVLRKIGVDTGGSKVQFGINAENGRVVVIEMNPRVSRSSALARSEEHTSELQSLMRISYAVLCLKKKKTMTTSSATSHISQSILK